MINFATINIQKLSRREIQSISYQKLIKESKTHQQAFDEIIKTFGYKADATKVAKIVGSTPSLTAMNKTLVLRVVLISLLSLILLARLLSIYFIVDSSGGPIVMFIVVSPFWVIMPFLGGFGAIKGRPELMVSAGVLLIIGVLRAFGNGSLSLDVFSIILLVFYGVTIALLFYIPHLFKVKYSFTRQKVEEEGRLKIVDNYVFEKEDAMKRDDLIDDL